MSYSCANPHKGHHVAHSNHSDSQHEKSSNPHFRSKRKPGKGAVRDVSNKNDHKIISRINTSVADREGVVNYSRAVRIKNSSVSQTGDKKGRTKPNTHAISVISLSRNDEGGPRITKPSATATKRKHSAVELGQRMEDKIE